MPDPTFALTPGVAQASSIRLRTLVILRWVAITGQMLALVVAVGYFRIQVDLTACLLIIATAVVANSSGMLFFPGNRRLNETETLGTLVFDVFQLGALLYFSGGLSNPFAILILTPVTISATALSTRATLFTGFAALFAITFVSLYHIPMLSPDGAVIGLPEMFLFGFWVALVIAIVFLALYAGRISAEKTAMSEALLATQMALAREQKLTDLGGVVAAAAHELGTPLATIKLVSAELLEELEDDDLREDAALIRDQAERCKQILHSMGRAGKDDLHMRSAPIAALIAEAAEPHQGRGKMIVYTVAQAPGGAPRQPLVLRRPEIIHGLRNLIQNAVDFADTTVRVEARWSDTEVSLRVIDDGPGFPPHLIGRIGDPFMRARGGAARPQPKERPGYDGMGLGLFIAKTLLERSGAQISFGNAARPVAGWREALGPLWPAGLWPARGVRPARPGAVISLRWPLEAVLSARPEGGLGENRHFEA